jgi:hypothetical protein
MNIYEDTPEYAAWQNSLKEQVAPVDIPKTAVATPDAGTHLSDETGFLENAKAGFMSAYRSIGYGSYDQEQLYGQEYMKLAKSGALLNMGLDPRAGYQTSPAQEYLRHKDIIEKYSTDNPDLGIALPSKIESDRLDALKKESEGIKATQLNASTLGKVGGIVGSLAGAMTDPIQIALAAIPGGQVEAGARLLSQVPRIWTYATAAAGAGSVVSKARDIAYRRDVLGEDVSKVNIPGEILTESAIGGVLGTGLVAGASGISRAIGKAISKDKLAPTPTEIPTPASAEGTLAPAPEQAPSITGETGTLLPGKQATYSTEVPWELPAQKGPLPSEVAGIDRENPYTAEMRSSLEMLKEQESIALANPSRPELQLSQEQQESLHALQAIDDLISEKPAEISQLEHIKNYADARSELEMPQSAVLGIQDKVDSGVKLTQEESNILDSYNNPAKRFDEGTPPLKEPFAKEEMDALHPDQIDATISDFLSTNKDELADFNVEDGTQIYSYLSEYSDSVSSLKKLQECLLTPKPRVRVQ